MASKLLLRRELERSQTAFTRYFFHVRAERFVSGEHHALIDECLNKLERGELKNGAGELCTILVVTIAPRYGKTQYLSIDWPARSIARNPRAKFIHLSYSDDLALDNSAKCRETVASPEYKKFWDVEIKNDADSKKKWYTKQGGGMYATSAGGPVTGFGAGSVADGADPAEQDELDKLIAIYEMAEQEALGEFMEYHAAAPDDGKFYGAIVIDDPIKVEDAESEKERERVNKRLNSTIKSRRNSRKTPIVIVMQRLHEDDMAGFVLDGGMAEPVYHLNLPAIIDYEKPTARSMWPHKHTLKELLKIRDADHAVFMAQYQQDPTPATGSFFKTEWFGPNSRFRLGEEPVRLVKYGAGDYAVTEKTKGSKNEPDWSEQAIAGFDTKEDLWFLDWWSGQVTIDKSIDAMIRMFQDHDPMLWAGESGVIRRAMEPYITKEQQRTRAFFKMEWLAATASKAANAKSFQALCSKGKVHIPYGEWGDALIAQLLKFTGKDDKRDDKVDVCGIFGRLLGQAFGPDVYHEQIAEKPRGSDYGAEEDDNDSGDWRTA